MINEDECVALDAVVPLPVDGEVGIGLFDVDRLGVSIPRQLRSESVRSIQQPSIPCLRREQDKLPNGNDSSVVSGCALLNVAYLIGETKVPAVDHALARTTPDGSSGTAMELFTKLFSDLLVFVYHCFDRVVIHGYLSGLSRPEQVVHFFRQVVGAPVVSKEVLSERTADYQNWVEAFARNHNIPIELRACARKTMFSPGYGKC